MEFLATCYGGDTSGCLDNEVVYLYWVEGITASTPGPFINVQPYVYLSETQHIGDNFFHFGFGNGLHGAQLIGNLFHVWAVHDGDVALLPIPEPQTYLMFLTGLGLLGFMLRLRNS